MHYLLITESGAKDGWDTGQRWKALAGAAHFSVRELAALCRWSNRQLERNFRRCLGCSPQSWLDEVRMEKAREFLLAGMPVKRVAHELSFKYTSYFCRRFKSKSKITPSEFVAANTGQPPL